MGPALRTALPFDVGRFGRWRRTRHAAVAGCAFIFIHRRRVAAGGRWCCLSHGISESHAAYEKGGDCGERQYGSIHGLPPLLNYYLPNELLAVLFRDYPLP